MRILPFKWLAITASIALSGAVMAGGNEDTVTLKQISGYRQWTKMNPEPAKVDSPVNFAAFAGG